MSTFSKLLLSQSTNGKAISVPNTGSPGNMLHSATSDLSSLDEIYLYCTNNNTASVNVYVQWGNTGSSDTFQTVVPPASGRTLIADGRLLNSGGVVYAYCPERSASFDGFVNRITISPSTVDPMVTLWAQRVVNNGGLAPSASTQTALTSFIQTLSNTGLLTKMYAVNCFVPDNLTAAITPLIMTSGNNLWTNTNFSLSDLTIHGLKGDASTKFLNIGFNGTNYPTDLDGGMTVYFSSTSSAGQYDSGYTSNDGSTQLGLQSYFSTNMFMYACWRSGTTTDIVTASGSVISPTTGSYISGNRTSSTQINLYVANSQISHSLVATGSGGAQTATRSSNPVFLFNTNAFQVGGAFGHANARISFAALHSGLTQGQSQIFFNAIQTLRQTIGGGYV
jgi:hypothetical protein